MNKGNIFIYSIFLVFFMVIFAYILSGKNSVLYDEISESKNNNRLLNNIERKSQYSFKSSFYDYTGSINSIYGYVNKDDGYFNIFWNSYQLNDFLDNIVNIDDQFSYLSATDSGFLSIETDDSFSIKVVEFQKDDFTNHDNLKIVNEWSGSGATGTGFIGIIDNNVSIETETGSAFIFDFANKDYGIFLAYAGNSNLLKYRLYGVDFSLKPLIMNGVDNSSSGLFRYFGSDIILSDNSIIKKIEVLKVSTNENIILKNIIN